MATGAALACPTRKVIALQADGSGAYTLQALWTIARESLDVVTILCSNRAYRILQIELARAGIAAPGPKAQALAPFPREFSRGGVPPRGFSPGIFSGIFPEFSYFWLNFHDFQKKIIFLAKFSQFPPKIHIFWPN